MYRMDKGCHYLWSLLSNWNNLSKQELILYKAQYLRCTLQQALFSFVSKESEAMARPEYR